MSKVKVKSIEKFPGDMAVDDRGVLRFVNGFKFKGVKRFYQVENFDLNMVRAWHGHLKEGKYVYVASGSVILGAVPLSDTIHPDRSAKVERVVLSAKKPQIVFIPPGFANGFKALENNTQILFFSTSTLEESKGDDYRFPFDYWGLEIWNTEYR
jgi:dTDP-4-dehydrorhamnose 3,5-epimerase-like enzyme